jgi:hypothetical protein
MLDIHSPLFMTWYSFDRHRAHLFPLVSIILIPIMSTRAASPLGLAAVAPTESTAEEKTGDARDAGDAGNDISMVGSENGRSSCQSRSESSRLFSTVSSINLQ